MEQPVEIPIKTRRSAWQKARAHAIAAAQIGALHTCLFRNEAWRSFWFREFELAQQIPLALETNAGESIPA